MARKSNKITVLQANEHALSALRVQPSANGVEVLDFAVERGPWTGADGALQAALKRFAEAHGLADDRVFGLIPRHDATARIVEFPSHDDVELEGMVRLSAEEFVPYPADELISAYTVLERNDDGTSKVLAVVVHKDVINAHIDLLRSAGLEPEQVLLSTTSLLSAIQVNAPDDVSCYAVVNLAAGGLEIVVLRDGVPEYVRGIASAQDWNSDNEPGAAALDELASEVRGSLSAHRRESYSGSGAERVYVCSDFATVAPIAAKLAHELDYECATAEVGLKGVTGVTPGMTDALPLVAVGAAMAAQGRGKHIVHLLPDQVLRRRASLSSRSRLLRMAVAAVLAVAALVGLYVQATYQREAYIAQLEQRAEGLRPRIKSMSSKRRHLERIQQQVERKDSVLELMAGVTGLIPPKGMNLQHFVYKRDSGITLIGRSTQLDMINKLTDDLRAASTTFPQFARARQLYSNMAKERDTDIWTFNVSIEFPQETTAETVPNE